MKRIILVDDELEILAPVEEMLLDEGYSVRSFSNPLKALEAIKQYHFDLAIMDIKMPEMNGLDLLQKAHSFRPNLPVIMLTSKAGDINEIIGMTAGASDYISKPFTRELVLLRIKSVLRRYDAPEVVTQKPIEVGDLFIDRDRHTVTWKGTHIDLTVTECLLLIELAERPGVVKKRSQLCETGGYVTSERTVDSHIRHIRSKFKEVDDGADIIGTVHGLGYRLKH